jgi:hypothetical protein
MLERPRREDGAVSDDLIQALRRVHNDLQVELTEAEANLTHAQQAVDAVRARCEAFTAQLGDVCAAAGFSVSAVLDERSEPDTRLVTVGVPAMKASQLENPLALPCRPQSQRWYAGQALHELGGEGSIAAIAEEMRRLGYEHSREPFRANQLEQSLAALPRQVPWIVPGGRPGHLRLSVGQQR